MSVIHVTSERFAELKASDKPVLLDFYATWCGPCRMVAPIVAELAEEHPEYVVGKIDVDEEPLLAEAFGIESIPTLVVLTGGRETNRTVGAIPKNEILSMLMA